MLTVAVAICGGFTAWMLARGARRAGAATRARLIRGGSGFRLPRFMRRRLRGWLTDAGSDLEPEAAIGWWTLGSGCALLIGFAIAPVTGLLVGVSAIASVPMLLAAGRRRMQRCLDFAVPELLEHVAGELRSGGTVALALADCPPAAPLQLDGITRRVALGAAFHDALAGWADRFGRRDVHATAGALGLAATVGGRAAEPLDGLAASLRARLAALADARALGAQARLSAIVVGTAPMGFVAFSALTDPGALRSLVGTGIGRMCLVVGVGLELIAVVWMQRILRSEP